MDEWDVTFIPWNKYKVQGPDSPVAYSYTEEDKVLERVAGESIVDVAQRWVSEGRIIKIELVER